VKRKRKEEEQGEQGDVEELDEEEEKIGGIGRREEDGTRSREAEEETIPVKGQEYGGNGHSSWNRLHSINFHHPQNIMNWVKR
jgi:hypothetical protein